MGSRILFLLAARCFACDCAPPGPICASIGGFDLAFVGTVTAASAGGSAARMTVDEVFKGAPGTSIEYATVGCGSPGLQNGRRYLVFGMTLGRPGEVTEVGCPRTRLIESSAEDLHFLRRYTSGKTATYISGSVSREPDGGGDPKPMKDAVVTVSAGGKTSRMRTDSLGKFLFGKLAPGTYEVSAHMPGYGSESNLDDVELAAGACALVDLFMKPDGQVRGIVRDGQGSPVAGVRVEMIPVKIAPPYAGPFLSGRSNDLGEYAIRGIPPGEYYLGVNIRSMPAPGNPFASTYHPNVRNRSAAAPVVVTLGASVQRIDLRAPIKLSVVTVRGQVQRPDGSPVSAEDHTQVQVRKPGTGERTSTPPVRTGVDGRFEVDLSEGVEYRLHAISKRGRESIYSAPLVLTPANNMREVVLVVDKSPEDFARLAK